MFWHISPALFTGAEWPTNRPSPLCLYMVLLGTNGQGYTTWLATTSPTVNFWLIVTDDQHSQLFFFRTVIFYVIIACHVNASNSFHPLFHYSIISNHNPFSSSRWTQSCVHCSLLTLSHQSLNHWHSVEKQHAICNPHLCDPTALHRVSCMLLGHKYLVIGLSPSTSTFSCYLSVMSLDEYFVMQVCLLTPPFIVVETSSTG